MTQPASDQRRGSSAARGYGGRWQKARATWLKRHPLCRMHLELGQPIPAEVVDHIVPHKLFDAKDSGDPARIASAEKLFWDRKNWQSLCKACHDGIKQQQEKSGTVPGCGLSGIPLDPNHHWSRAIKAMGEGG